MTSKNGTPATPEKGCTGARRIILATYQELCKEMVQYSAYAISFANQSELHWEKYNKGDHVPDVCPNHAAIWGRALAKACFRLARENAIPWARREVSRMEKIEAEFARENRNSRS